MFLVRGLGYGSVMSKSVSRAARRRHARKGTVSDVVALNLGTAKPRFDGSPVGKPSQGFSMVRTQGKSGAFDTTRTKGPRAHDPAGNTFTAKTAPGSRPRRDTLVTEQGPLVFERGPDGVVRCYRDVSQKYRPAGSQPAPFEPADYSTVNRMNNPHAVQPSYR